MQDETAQPISQTPTAQGQNPDAVQPQQVITSTPPQTDQQTDQPQQGERGIFKSTWFWVFIVLIILLAGGVGFVWFYVLPSMSQDRIAPTTQTGQDSGSVGEFSQSELTGNNQIVVEDQALTNRFEIQVERVEVNANSFLVFYMPLTRDVGGSELMVASTSILVPDVYTDFKVPIFTPERGSVDQFQFSRIRAGGEVYATLHKDVDGNSLFDPEIDNERLKDPSGNDIRVTFKLIPPN